MAKEVIAKISSDTHLRRTTWAQFPQLRHDSFFSLSWIASYFSGQRLPLILAGDIFNVNYPDSYTVQRARDILDGDDVYFIEGQHEGTPDVPWMRVAVSHSMDMDRQTFRFGEFTFYGLSFRKQGVLQEELQKIPESTDVLVAHQVWEEFMGDITQPEGSAKDVPHVRTIITGDFHGHQRRQSVNAVGEEVVMVSPGSSCMQNMAEDPKKYFYLMFDDGTFESVEIPTRPVIYVLIRHPDDLDRLAETLPKQVEDCHDPRLPEEIQKPILRPEFLGTVPDCVQRLRSITGDRAFLMPKLIVASGFQDDEEETVRKSNELFTTNMVEALPRVCDARGPVYQTSLRLLQTNDQQIDEELNRIVGENIRTELE